MSRYFTKSRFKTALSCPTKLYFESNPETYANSKIDDPFLKALAKGGFQVGALAQCYYPGGNLISTHDKVQALKETNELLKQENVVIFEAAITYQNLFVRIDILEKKGKNINVIEVKSKSVDPVEFPDQIWNKNALKKGRHEMTEKWKSYIYDVAFQTHVCKLANSSFTYQSFLMCADKTKYTTVEGLNQRFFLRDNNEVECIGDISVPALGNEILTRLNVTDIVSIIHSDQDLSERFDGRGWVEGIEYLAEKFINNEKIITPVSADCKKCQFRCENENLKSGFKECWQHAYDLTAEELSGPMVFDIWNFRGSQKVIESDKILMTDMNEVDFSQTATEKGLSTGQRQRLQVEKVQNKDDSAYYDFEGMAEEFSKLTYPLHMIDFETCMVAIPFSKGKHPYQQIAFQFSHHIIQESGTSYHAHEYINCERGLFPNFIFVRELKKALDKDKGTIFRYSNHENTVLNQIKDQLQDSQEPDKDELISFIKSITDDAPRTMIDLCELVKRYYYNPSTQGSNSIKYVLPAILNESEYLKQKYSQPTYNSGNFRNHQWISLETDGSVQDPYKMLPPIMMKYDYETLENNMSEGSEDINNGGAALSAYALLQFTQMPEKERLKIKEALLRYCELDTLAMVMIFEHWKDKIYNSMKKQKS